MQAPQRRILKIVQQRKRVLVKCKCYWLQKLADRGCGNQSQLKICRGSERGSPHDFQGN